MNQYVESITLDDLIDFLIRYKNSNKGYGSKQVYFDHLHIEGKMSDYGDVLELY